MFGMIGVIFLVLAALALVVGVYLKAGGNLDSAGGAFLFGTISGLVGFVSILIGSIVIIEPGCVGVQVFLGSTSQTVLPAGIHMVNPLTHVVHMSVRTESYLMTSKHDEGAKHGDDSVSVTSANGLTMPMDISIPYRLIPETAPWVYENLGSGYVDNIVRQALSTATRRAVSKYTAEECYSTKRDELADTIRKFTDEEMALLLRQGYSGKNPPEQILVVSQVLVGHIGLPESVKASIESKIRADQEQQAMDFRIKREEKEADRKRSEARGIRDFQEIVSKGVDERLLRWKAIEATLHLAESQNTKIVIIGNSTDGLPVMLGGFDDKKK